MQTAVDRNDRLYELLPAVIRIRDHERGEPLRALLQVVAEQVNVIDDDIAQLYENWFIETCQDWVVPYIGDLVGELPVHEAGEPGDPLDAGSRARNRILVPRREVANAIHNRRRKGTLALLETLARDVSGWPARAVEFRRQLGHTHAVRTCLEGRHRTVDLRESRSLAHIGDAFDRFARVPDLRRVNSTHGPGRFNVPAVGLFVWRLGAYPVTHAPAYCVEDAGPNCFTFSVLGNDAPLYNRPMAQADANAIAGELDVPDPISRREFSQRREDARQRAHAAQTPMRAADKFYGLVAEPGSRMAQSVVIWARGWAPTQQDADAPIPAARIVPADLSGWHYVPRNGEVAVDPVRGRIAFPPRQLPKRGVWVSYHYGFSADMGGGEYTRPLRGPDGVVPVQVRGKDELQRALEPWRRPVGSSTPDTSAQPKDAIIEIVDSGVYVLPIHVHLAPGHTLQIRAAQRTRPVIKLLDWHANLPDNLSVTGGEGSRLTLDGLLIAGRGVQVEGALTNLTVRHSTLVPGWSLAPNCDPERPAEPSIELIDTRACVVIDHSIVGSIQVNDSEVKVDPLRLRILDSIVDATGTDCESPECEAVGAAGSALAHATLDIRRSTVIGRVMVHAIELAENSIFLSRITVARRQHGCMRFCYVRPKSRTPRRFHCQPDLAVQAVDAELQDSGASNEEIEAARERERQRLRPDFESIRYGMPTYCQLSQHCAPEILRGADDQSEMGAFHDLFQPQRLANLRARLAEYTPAATDVGIIFET